MVAIVHIAERDAVEREAELVLRKAADRDARRPFIGAERVGRLEIDPGQLVDRFQRADPRHFERDIGGAQFLHLPRLPLAEHDDLFDIGAIGRIGRGFFGKGRRRGQHGERSDRGGPGPQAVPELSGHRWIPFSRSRNGAGVAGA